MSESTQEDGPRTDSSSTARTTVLAVVGTLVALSLIGLVTALVVVLVKYDRVKDDAAQQRAEVRAAREAAYDLVLDMTQYSYDSLEQDFAWYEEDTTAAFRETFKVADTVETARELRVQANGDVSRIAAERNDDGTVTVLAFVDQSVKAGSQEPSLLLTRLELTMVEQDGRWLADDARMHNPDGPLN